MGLIVSAHIDVHAWNGNRERLTHDVYLQGFFRPLENVLSQLLLLEKHVPSPKKEAYCSALWTGNKACYVCSSFQFVGNRNKIETFYFYFMRSKRSMREIHTHMWFECEEPDTKCTIIMAKIIRYFAFQVNQFALYEAIACASHRQQL